ncbi:MAG TPA: hypothetical protein VFU72_13225 [Nitrolancea sp.]|jgi:hypothetical protein|nr:hypothetical protein [Nitrolancea sp.]
MLDASAWVGTWAFAPSQRVALAGLVRTLTVAGLAGAAVSPVEAVLAPEPMAANRHLLAAAARRRAGDFAIVPVPILDPSLPAWREHLAECSAQRGDVLRAVKIVPNYHEYSLGAPAVAALAAELARRDLGLCVQLRLADERAHRPSLVVPGVDPACVTALAVAQPDLRVLVCGAYMSDLAVLAPAANIATELSFVESGYLLRDALAHLGPDRLLLGTHAPLHYAAPGVAKLGADALSPGVSAQLGTDNFRRFFGMMT